MKRVLLIAYHCPPDLAVGATRVAKTAKYLARLGWTPYVLTVEERYAERRDDGRLADLAGVRIVRTAVWPTALELAMRVRDGLRRRTARAAAAASRPTAAGPARPGVRWYGRLTGAAKRYLGSLFELPDKQVGWLLPATWAAFRLVQKEDIPVVMTSSPPATTALVGLLLSFVTGARIVTELRDPWFLPLGDPNKCRSALGDAIQRWLERLIVTRSSQVVTTTEHYRDFLRGFYTTLPRDRFRTIWNGYDPEDFAGLEAIAPSPVFTISYLGTFYYGRSPRQLLRAVSELVGEGVIGPAGIRLNFIGEVKFAEGESVEELVKSYGLAGCVAIREPVTYAESLQRMREASVLLLLAPDQYYCIPAKAFEYIGARRKVLCLARDGATAELVRNSGAGVVVDPSDVGAIKAALRELYEEHRRNRRRPSVAEASRYDRGRLTRELAGLLEGALAGPPRPAERRVTVTGETS
jgi:glycosyltransferase involved in cell wall biosynthesis